MPQSRLTLRNLAQFSYTTGRVETRYLVSIRVTFTTLVLDPPLTPPVADPHRQTTCPDPDMRRTSKYEETDTPDLMVNITL